MLSIGLKTRIKLAARVLFGDVAAVPAAGRRPPDEADVAPPEGAGACPAESVLAHDTCPVCGHVGRTLVCEYNKFLVFDRPPDGRADRYDYSLCHACGVVCAALRPVGERYRWLFEHFEATIGRTDTGHRSVRKLTLSAFDLTEAERAELKSALARGVFVSDHLGLSRKEYIPSLASDRLAIGAHVELLGSLRDLRGKRVLEIRSRSGAMSASLARLYGVHAHVMALFENQRLVVAEAYGLPTSPIDYEDFQPPPGQLFDVIVANHMLTHAVRPSAFLDALHGALAPGGLLYLYNEPDEEEYLSDGKSIINSLNAFHLQAFDGRSLTRALAAHGFRVTFLTRQERTFLCLSEKVDGPVAWTPMDAREREGRVRRHQQSRDLAILMLPRHLHQRFASEWSAFVDRVTAAGVAEIDADGQVRRRKGR
jgi:hypothetical protein